MTHDDWLAHQFLRDRWREKAGLPPLRATAVCPPLSSMARTEWSEEFERLQRNRLLMGALRYGLMGAPGKRRWDRVSDVKRRLDLYTEDGNLEHLVDCANLLQLEFVGGKHPKRHFTAADDAAHSTEVGHT